MQKKTLNRVQVKNWLKEGLTASRIAKEAGLTTPTVRAIIARDHKSLFCKLESNGKANHGGVRRASK